ncbi:Cytoplasmic glyoxalase II [Tulasnella sp. JGI-2019a]|nr:Cytoplasmic glyoxalase II [Tulasnella sp. JGI-2019a]
MHPRLLQRTLRNLNYNTQRLSTTPRLPMKIVPVPVRSDNYAYLLIDEETKEAAVVDPFDVAKVRLKVEEEGVKCTTLLTTHHHADHSGGNEEFAKQYPGVKVVGGSKSIPALTAAVRDGDTLEIGKNIKIKCMATPCHTQDSICYYVTDTKNPSQRGVFTGDTLFIGGCGRFFEGTAEEMHKSLSYLGTLPDDTVTWVGHEYTASNFKFNSHIDPENEAIKRGVKTSAENKVTTGTTTIADEKEFNVFMRLDSQAVRNATGASDAVTAMEKLRSMKNSF